MAKALIAFRCETPFGDTRGMADAVERLVADVPAIEFERHASAPHIANLVMRVRGARPGRRLIFNGHMDTFPLADPARWTADPSGEERDGRLYGLGSSDMKSGLAAILFALRQLARHREFFAGEVVATFAGDEETMGELGSQFLLDTVPHAKGDAMISADAGSPRVLRFGEKGMIWLTLRARGRSSHAAHVHRGDSAIDKLLAVIGELQKLRHFKVNAPAAVTAAIGEAAAISEPLSGAGESDVLRSVTVTIGTIKGGRLRNLVSDSAEATADIRIPVGVTVAQIERDILRAVAGQEGVECVIERRYEPTWTPPDHEVIELLARNCAAVLGAPPVRNMRVGASDARLYRRAGVPTVVCGLTPYNMGNADEYVDVAELLALGDIFALTAFDLLNVVGA
ncbi:MAG: M20/M25/M40 family metallo-hydrolase [Pseudolabrys sp.]|nr:M20/M25/M40 family metallo-hydrolase [Pseudolabrys sp.]